MSEILATHSGSILTLSFNRPAKMNALTRSMYAGLAKGLNDAAGDQFVWSQGQNVQDFWFTDDNGQYNWGDWRQLPTFIGNTAGGAFVLSAPAPGAIALLGMVGLMSR
ncbi:MAG: hypothetical protein EB113_06985, partial [Actinobacteria bacterium]|nr:hypothetical protein [Actinomycetota bacterium]